MCSATSLFLQLLENPHTGDVLGMSIYKQRGIVKGIKKTPPNIRLYSEVETRHELSPLFPVSQGNAKGWEGREPSSMSCLMPQMASRV